MPDADIARRIIACIAQAESGDYDSESTIDHIYGACDRIGPQGDKQPDHFEKIIELHKTLVDIKGSQAEYRVLKEISELESFGEELFFCKPVSASNNAHNLYGHILYHARMEENRGEEQIDGGGTVGCLAGGAASGGCGCRLGPCVGVGPRGLVLYRPDCSGDHEIGDEKQR